MAKKRQTAEEPQLPINWTFPPDLISRYATNIIVQLAENEFVVSFFEIPPPVLLRGQEDLDKLESVTAQCVSRIIIAAEKMPQFVDVLNRQLSVYQERKAAAANES
jgi:hypothetical protein